MLVLKTVQLMNGEVLSQSVSDPVETDMLDYWVETVRENVRDNPRNMHTVDTFDGVVEFYENGLVIVYAIVPA